jgi:hypothetical protein
MKACAWARSAKLASFDSNRDDVVDARDERFAELAIWRDVNANHRTDAGELASLAHYGVASLSTRYVLAPEMQNGNWLLEHGTATFEDGRAVSLVDAYFAIDAVNAKAATTPEERGASITVRSELPQSVLPAGAPSFASGAAFDRPIARIDQAPPVIDWTGSAPSALDGSGAEDQARKTRHSKGAWLAEFLGTTRPWEGKDLAQRTGLKIRI